MENVTEFLVLRYNLQQNRHRKREKGKARRIGNMRVLLRCKNYSSRNPQSFLRFASTWNTCLYLPIPDNCRLVLASQMAFGLVSRLELAWVELRETS